MSISITTNSGKSYVTTVSITLALTPPAGADQMAFSDTGDFTSPTWENVAATKSYTLPSGDGPKTVYVQWGTQTNQGVVAAGSPETASTILDMKAPTGTLVINGGDGTTASRSVKLALIQSDVTTVEYRMRNENEPDFPVDWTAIDSFPQDWTVSPGQGWKTVFVELRDLAGKDGVTGHTTIVTDQIEYLEAVPGMGLWLNFKTPDYQKNGTNKESYFRIGAAKTTDENPLVAKGKLSSNDEVREKTLSGGNTRDGWFEYTDGDRTVITRGQRAEVVKGKRLDSTDGDQMTYVKGERLVVTHTKNEVVGSNSHTFNWGATLGLYGGLKYIATVGTVMGTTIGGTVTLNATVDVSATVSHKIDFAFGTKVSWATTEIRHTKDSATKAQKSIHLRVKSAESSHFNRRVVSTSIACAIGGAVAAAATGTLVGLGEADPENVAGSATTLAVGGVASIVSLVASVLFLKHLKLKNQTDDKLSDTEIEMKQDKIKLSQNDAAGAYQAKLTLKGGKALIKNTIGASLKLDDDGDIMAEAKKTMWASGEQSAYLSAGDSTTNCVRVDALGNIDFRGQQASFFNGALLVMA